MSKNRLKKIIPILGVMLLTLLQFQNCAKKEFTFEDSLVATTMEFFEYRYEKATPIYFEIQILQNAEDSGFIKYDIKAVAAPSDGSQEAVDYIIQVIGTDNTVWKDVTGQLPAGETLIEDDITLQKTTKIGSVVMKVKKSSGGDWNVYTKKYN